MIFNNYSEPSSSFTRLNLSLSPHTAHKAAEDDLKAAQDKQVTDEADLQNEEKMIRMIMRYIGILHDVKATEKSIAAGGKDSVKNDNGISNPYVSDSFSILIMSEKSVFSN